MKRIAMLFVMVAVMMAVPMTASAGGLWSLAKNTGIPVIQPANFALEVKGTNIRMYVFDVPNMNSRCISVWGEDSQQLVCKTFKEIENGGSFQVNTPNTK